MAALRAARAAASGGGGPLVSLASSADCGPHLLPLDSSSHYFCLQQIRVGTPAKKSPPIKEGFGEVVGPGFRRPASIGRQPGSRSPLLLPEVDLHRDAGKKSPSYQGGVWGGCPPGISPAGVHRSAVREPSASTSAGSRSASGRRRNPSARACCFRGNAGRAP